VYRSAIRRFIPNELRHARGAPKSGANRVTLRRWLPNTWLGPSQVDGTNAGFSINAAQSGAGTDDPTQMSCACPLMSPLASAADANS